MIFLIAFAFLAGTITILSPCILPILPIVLSTGMGGQKSELAKPLGVILGFIASFTFFTLFLTTLVSLLGIPADTLRYISIFIVGGFGIAILVPSFQAYIEQVFSKFTGLTPKTDNRNGFVGGVIIGLSLGLLWTPCVGPILASVIALAVSGTVTLASTAITLAYATGTAIPMLGVMLGGRKLLTKVPWLTHNTARIQKLFGVLMIATAVAIYFNADRKLQTVILNLFPNYGTGLTKIEDNAFVQDQLKNLNAPAINKDNVGKPSSDILPNSGPIAPELVTKGVWFNSKPLSLAELRGKVVVIDFWTYSCINCQRTLPYLKTWWEKYKDKGLVIIGVHAPEFAFEKEEKNVAKAIKDFGLTYPIVQDNEFTTWKAYENHYWPAKYIIDKDGVIRYTHFGEGKYDETEKVIQELLGTEDTTRINNQDYQIYARTPETYIGYARLSNFSSPETILKDRLQTYSRPTTIPNNTFALEGEWLETPEYAKPSKSGVLYLNFDAREVFLVLKPKGANVKVKVFVDAKPQYFGEDVVDGVATLDSDRLYKLVKLPNPGKHILRLEFEDNSVEVYAFTFG